MHLNELPLYRDTYELNSAIVDTKLNNLIILRYGKNYRIKNRICTN